MRKGQRNQLCLERSHSLPQSCQSKLSFSPSTVEQNIKDGAAGITCSNQDLRSILTNKDLTPTSGGGDEIKPRRKTLTLLQRGLEVRGFFDTENAMQWTKKQHQKVKKCRRSVSMMVTWDNESQLSIDPSLIGASIETYLHSKLTLNKLDENEEDPSVNDKKSENTQNTNILIDFEKEEEENVTALPPQRPSTLPIKIIRTSSRSKCKEDQV